MNEQEKKAYVEKKARELTYRHFNKHTAKDFILSIIKDWQPKVSREFIKKWKKTFKQMDGCYTPSSILIEFSEAFVKELNVEMEE